MQYRATRITPSIWHSLGTEARIKTLWVVFEAMDHKWILVSHASCLYA